jgi:hypothetical protein
LNWLAPTSADPATSYIIEAGSSSGATNIAVFDTGTAATTLTVTGVPSGTYFVRVRAQNTAGSSAPSNEIVLTVGVSAPCIPGPPTGLSALVVISSVTFTWSAPAGSCAPISYNVFAGSVPGASDIASIALPVARTSFTAISVPSGTYYVRVSSGTPSGPGPVSNEVVVTVAGAPPSPGSVTGRWVGLVANGDGATNSFGERWDWQLDLTQTGSSVTGTLTQTAVNADEPVGTVKVAPLTGTAGSGTFSFTINPTERPIVASATFTASRMTGTLSQRADTGSFAVNRQ